MTTEQGKQLKQEITTFLIDYYKKNGMTSKQELIHLSKLIYCDIDFDTDNY